jgi:outer membrane protein TolC
MKRYVACALILGSQAFAQTETVMTLEQAIALGRTSSRSLKISAARADAAVARAGEAETALLPGLRFSGSYLRVSDGVFTLSTGGTPILMNPPPVVVNNYIFRLGVQQPLFTGFRLSNSAKAAEYQAQAGILQRDMDDADLVLGVTSAYWSLYQALQTQKYVDENVLRLESYQADTERLLKAGLATRNDLLKVQVQLATARVTQIDARNDVQLAGLNLNNIIGQSLETTVIPSSDPQALMDTDTLVHGRSDLTSRAWEQRKDLQAVSLLAEAARAGVNAARGAYWPQVDLLAAYNYNQPNSRYQPITNAFYGNWEIGVQLQMDLWNWGRTARQTEQAEAAVSQNEQQLAQLKDNITLEVRRASLTLGRSREKLGVARLAVDQAEENRRMTNDRYRNGIATSSDLLDAEVALLQSKTNFTGAVVEYALAKARLERAVGGASAGESHE